MTAPPSKYFGLGKNACKIAHLFRGTSYKNCMWNEVSSYTFLHKEKSFSTSKRAILAIGPKCHEPCRFAQGLLLALSKTAWHPECWKKPSQWHWPSPGSLGNLGCVGGQLSCRMNVSSARVSVCIPPGSQGQLVTSYSERWGFRVQLLGICYLSKQKDIGNTSEMKC